MRTFTSNPLERMMMQVPRTAHEKPPRAVAPEGHFCHGCGNYGLGCVRPCYRDAKEKPKSAPER